jgi:hypothetical protein
MEKPVLEDVRCVYAALIGPMKAYEVQAELQKLREETQAWRKAQQDTDQPRQ